MVLLVVVFVECCEAQALAMFDQMEQTKYVRYVRAV